MIRLMQRGGRDVPTTLTSPSVPWPAAAVTLNLNATCDECGSSFHAATSRMESLCAECAHHLYGYPACEHRMVAGRCASCGWDGSVSDYILHITGRGKTR